MDSKKKKQLEILVGVKKTAPEITSDFDIEFHVSEHKIIPSRELFSKVREAIHSLEIDKTLTIKYKPEYNLSFNDFKKKITNIAFGHSSKYIEKRFTTCKADNQTITITRLQNKTF